MIIKNIFKRYEYEVGVGYYEIPCIKKGFLVSEYLYDLFVGYYLAFTSIGFMIFSVAGYPAPVFIRVLFGFVSIALAVMSTMKSLQKARDLHNRLRKVPIEIKRKARLMCGSDWRESSIECYEAHLPCDCTLCGAC